MVKDVSVFQKSDEESEEEKDKKKKEKVRECSSLQYFFLLGWYEPGRFNPSQPSATERLSLMFCQESLTNIFESNETSFRRRRILLLRAAAKRVRRAKRRTTRRKRRRRRPRNTTTR